MVTTRRSFTSHTMGAREGRSASAGPATWAAVCKLGVIPSSLKGAARELCRSAWDRWAWSLLRGLDCRPPPPHFQSRGLELSSRVGTWKAPPPPSSLSPPAMGTDISTELLCYYNHDPRGQTHSVSAVWTGQAPGVSRRRSSRTLIPEFSGVGEERRRKDSSS